jgi:hypothetical protein
VRTTIVLVGIPLHHEQGTPVEYLIHSAFFRQLIRSNERPRHRVGLVVRER